MNETIVANATADGIGSISIIRVSGSRALEFATKITKRSFKPRYATLCNLYCENGELLDECIVIYFKAPFSFTGEDVIEFQTHGGYMIANLIEQRVINLGARLARAGEFSKRAYLNNKMDLAKASAIASIINARNEDAIKILMRVMSGELKEFVDTLRAELVKTLAFVEVCIDYADEDLPETLLKDASLMLRENIEKLEQIVKISMQRKGLIDGFKIAIVGKPNVGKSSILNSLLKLNRAIITDIEGTTTDRIEESLKVGTHLVRIIDTAGIREAKGLIEKLGIENSIKAIDEADIIVAVFDGSRVADIKDEKILELLKKSGKEIIYLLNKADLEFKFDKKLTNPLQISAKTNTDPLLERLKEVLDSKNYDGLLLTASYQIDSCIDAKEHLQKAKEWLDDENLELFATEINLSIDSISSITRPYQRDEILDEMFGNFCLGK